MAEFLHADKVSLDEVTDIYINELQAKFNTLIEKFKKTIIPADQAELTVKRELSFVIDLTDEIDTKLGNLMEFDNTPLPKAESPIDYFEYLAIHSTAHDLEHFIPDTIKNKDAYWGRVKLAYRKTIIQGYMWFLQGILETIFNITRSPEYWNMRTIAEMEEVPAPSAKPQGLDENNLTFLRNWINAGQVIKNTSGDYVTAATPQDFCFWLFSKYKIEEIPPPEVTAKTLANDVKLTTWKRYYNDAGIKKNRYADKSCINPA